MRMSASRAAFAAVLLSAAPIPVSAQTPATAPAPAPASTTATVRVQNAWARASAGQSGTSAAYLTVETSGAADQLVGVSAPVAAKAELHETTQAGGVMRMRPVAAIAVAPGKPAVLAPGGFHIMLMGLTKPLRTGDRFPLTLSFAQSAPVTVTVTVAPAGASGPDMMHGDAMHGGAMQGGAHGH